ncbi:MAG: TonB-dependent receptor [Burkholderiaceae bacterium]
MKLNLIVVGIFVAYGAINPVFGQDAQKIERVEVTGSSIKRIDGETALPVTIITRSDILKLGVQSTSELVDKVSANNGGGYAAALGLGDSARPGFSGASLRGLGSNNTLVLLNGRRLAVYAFDGGGVDLNSIPFDAIDRVEILRDGASAVYGSDAIGGVINFITRKDFVGGSLNASIGVPQKSGGGSYYTAGGAYGFGDLSTDKFNILGALTIKKEKSLKSNARSFSNTAFIPEGPVDNTSGNAFPANIATPDAFVNPFAPAFGRNCSPPLSFGRTPDEEQCRFNYAAVIDTIPQKDQVSGILRATLQLNENTQLVGEAALSRTKQVFRISPTPASEATTRPDPLTGITAQLLYPANGAFYPGAGVVPAIPGVTLSGPLNLYYRTLELGPRTNQSTADQGRFSVGLIGAVAGWDYDTALSHAESKSKEEYLGGYVLESRIIPAMATGLINPFGFNNGAGLDLLASTQYIGPTRNSKSTRDTFDARASRDIATLPAGPLSLAAGFETRREKFNDEPLPILRTSDIIGGGGDQLPVVGARTVNAVFGELNVPILKGLESQIALRHDRYSDFGTTTNPKISLRWQPTNQFLIRASAGTGFRAPTLPDLIAPPAITNTGGSYNDPYYDAVIGCDNVFSAKYCGAQLSNRQAGNPLLKPEKSKQFTLGLLFEPTRDVSIGFDLFRINQKDVIGIILGDVKLNDFINNFNPTTLTSTSIYAPDVVTRVDPISGATVINYVDSAFENLTEQKTSGVDISMRFRVPKTAIGDFTLKVDGTYLDKLEQRLKNQPEFTQTVGQFAQFGAIARFKHVTALTWDYNQWSSTLTYNFQSGYYDQYPDPQGNIRKVSAYETWDALLQYKGIKNLTVSAGVRNLLNKKPPFTNQDIYFQLGYDPTYADPRLRTFYLTGNYEFK